MDGQRNQKTWPTFLWNVLLIIIFALFLKNEAWALPDFKVRNELGQETTLKKVLGKDSILLLGYFGCEHLCQFTIKNLVSKMSRFKHHPRMVFLSVNEEETFHDGTLVKKQIKGPAAKYWTLLTADQESIKELTQNISFSWKKDIASGTITHESALFVMKDGEFARKLPGFDLKEKDLDLATPRGKFFDFKQFCSAFDPSNSRYGHMIMKTLSATSMLFLIFAVGSWTRLRRKK